MSGTVGMVNRMIDEHIDIQPIAEALVNNHVQETTFLGGGRNSRVYSITCEDGTRFAVKQYTSRQRLETEFAACRFLHEHLDAAPVPRAIAYDPFHATAVYEFIAGATVKPGAVTPDLVDDAIAFLIRLAGLSYAHTAEWRVDAAEARFTFTEVLGDIRNRLSLLQTPACCSERARDLALFLEGDLNPVLDAICIWGKDLFARQGFSLARCLPEVERVLSPSDFGFHNAIQKADGSLCFVDLEYFGWDDPAKMTADFILHPAMDLTENLKRQFVKGLCCQLPQCQSLPTRLPVAFALFGVKWCLILLNEFVAEHQVRRRFAGDTRNEDEILCDQLNKARAMLTKVMDTYREFPYFD